MTNDVPGTKCFYANDKCTLDLRSLLWVTVESEKKNKNWAVSLAHFTSDKIVYLEKKKKNPQIIERGDVCIFLGWRAHENPQIYGGLLLM